MKRSLPTIFVLFVLWSVAYGQSDNSQAFGHITQSEIALQQNPQYHNASAVVLQDLGKSSFEFDEDNETAFIVFQRDTRIKIFTEAGIKYAKVKIYFQNGYGISERVSHIKAVTYNLDKYGNLVKTSLNPKNIYYEKVKNEGGVVKFVLPNVKKGSIIEYRYQLVTNSVFRLPSWKFQRTIPVLYSRYEVRMVPFFQYDYILHGRNKFDDLKNYKDISVDRSFAGVKFNDLVHDYIMRNVPAFKDEQYIPSINDYLIGINFQLSKEIYPNGTVLNVITTWKSLINDRLKDDDFGKYVDKSERLSEKMLDMNKLCQLPEKVRFDSIINYMKDDFSWDGDENKFATKKPKQFLIDRSGDAQDINLFTVGMLRAAKIQAYPVLISTKSHGRILYNYPYFYFFNDAIIYAVVDGKPVLSDASAHNCLNDRIPIRCVNDKGLIIKKGKKAQWVSLNRTPISKTIMINNLSFQQDTLKTSVMLSATEYDALELRNSMPEDHKALVKYLTSNSYDLVDSTVSVENQNNRSKPYELSYRFTYKPLRFGSKIFISPFLGEVRKTNMFTQDRRTHPVDLNYPDVMQYMTVLNIPPGYKIENLPSPVSVDNNLFTLNYSAIHFGNKLKMVLVYYFKKGIYPASDYTKLKSFFAQVIKKAHEKVVLSKETVAMK